MIKINAKIHIRPFLFFLLISNHTYSQKVPSKDTVFIVYGIPTYDSLGNKYDIAYKLNHTPTHLDSVDLNIRTQDYFLKKHVKQRERPNAKLKKVKLKQK